MKNAYKLQNTKRRKWSRNGTCRLTREKCSMSCSKTSTCAVHTYFLDTIIEVSMYILEDLIPSSAKDNIRISHTHTMLSGSCFFFYYLHFTTCVLFPIMVLSFFPFFFFSFSLLFLQRLLPSASFFSPTIHRGRCKVTHSRSFCNTCWQLY